MITIWDAVGVPTRYDRERVDKVRKVEHPHGYEEDEWAPGTRRPITADALRAGRGYNPWREAGEKNRDQGRREQALLAEQIMSRQVRTIGPDATVGDAWDLVVQHRYRHLPVLDDAGSLVGIVSDRDLLRVGGTPDDAPDGDVRGLRVRAVMNSPVFSAHPDTPIREIANVMFAERIGAMPICDDQLALVGILTRSDILRTLVNRAPLDLWV